MSIQCEITATRHTDPLGLFGRYLTIWVFLCIVIGIALGNFLPKLFEFISQLEIYHINLVVAVLIWIMIYPMMVNVDFNSLKYIGERPKGLIITSVTNWLIKPFTMALLGWLFFEILFRQWSTFRCSTSNSRRCISRSPRYVIDRKNY